MPNTSNAWSPRDVEQFLYAEAALLDTWKLEEWLALFTEDCTYIIPSTDLPEGDPKDSLVFVDDNHVRLQGRVRRLGNPAAHREWPRSRNRHFISNVRIVGEQSDGDVIVEANFIIYRFKEGTIEPFVGHYRYQLTRRDNRIMIRHKRATLDLESLRGQGAVSTIL